MLAALSHRKAAAESCDGYGVRRSGEIRGRGKGLSLPNDAGRQGMLGGEVDGVEELRCVRDSSSESVPTAVVVGRGCFRRSGAQVDAKPCQRGAQVQERKGGSKEEARGRQGSPAVGGLADGNGGAASLIGSSLAAYLLGFWWQNEAEQGGLYGRGRSQQIPSK